MEMSIGKANIVVEKNRIDYQVFGWQGSVSVLGEAGDFVIKYSGISRSIL